MHSKDLIEYIKEAAQKSLQWLKVNGPRVLGGVKQGLDDTWNWKNIRKETLDRRQNLAHVRDKCLLYGMEYRIRDKCLGNLGDYCRKDSHCYSQHCQQNAFSAWACAGSRPGGGRGSCHTDPPCEGVMEYRREMCKKYLFETKCLDFGCKWTLGKKWGGSCGSFPNEEKP